MKKASEFLSSTDGNHVPDPAEVEEARRVRTVALNVIEQARRARQMTSPGGYHLEIKANVIGTNLGPSNYLREIFALLNLDALVSALDGEPDRAIDSTHAGVNAARGLGEEPTMISMLIRIAGDSIAKIELERVLALSEPKAGLADLQATLAAEADAPIMRIALRGERAMFDRLFSNLDSGVLDFQELAESGKTSFNPQAAFGWWRYRGYLPEDRAFFLEFVTRFIEIDQKPPHERKELYDQEEQAFQKAARSRDSRHLMTYLLLPAWNKFADADMRNKANLRCAVAGIASERFRQAKGRWPNELD
jgi:hypothetical protein